LYIILVNLYTNIYLDTYQNLYIYICQNDKQLGTDGAAPVRVAGSARCWFHCMITALRLQNLLSLLETATAAAQAAPRKSPFR